MRESSNSPLIISFSWGAAILSIFLSTLFAVSSILFVRFVFLRNDCRRDLGITPVIASRPNRGHRTYRSYPLQLLYYYLESV